MNRFFAEYIKENVALLDSEESRHLAMVLRLNAGERIEVVHEGRLFLASVIDNDKKCAKAQIIEEKQVCSEPKLKVTLFQALPKGGKMEFAVQKCTEIGVCDIVPVITKRCVAKGSEAKIERLNRVAFEACKQCKRVAVPVVSELKQLHEVDFGKFDIAIVAYEDEENIGIGDVLALAENPKTAAIIIGPEGGFEKDEIDELKAKGVKCASLGKRILRSETAGMVLLSAMFYHFGEMSV